MMQFEGNGECRRKSRSMSAIPLYLLIHRWANEIDFLR